MATVTFTSALKRFLPVPVVEAEGTTLAAVLDTAFAANPALRGYVLDDQGAVRRHVSVFVNGRPAVDRATLSDPIGPDDEIHVLQALSGG